MNQTSTIRLTDYLGEEGAFGNAAGKEAFRKLSDYVDANPQFSVIGVSLENISMTDASFPRESVVALAKQYRGQKGVFITDAGSPDVVDNWKYAAIAKDQPLVFWSAGGDYQVLGPEASASNMALIDFVLSRKESTVADVAAAFDLSIPNASTRLKKLVDQGYFIRTEVAAETGGKEFIYHPAK